MFYYCQRTSSFLISTRAKSKAQAKIHYQYKDSTGKDGAAVSDEESGDEDKSDGELSDIGMFPVSFVKKSRKYNFFVAFVKK